MQKTRIWIRYKSKMWNHFLESKDKKVKSLLSDFERKMNVKPIIEKDEKTYWVQVP